MKLTKEKFINLGIFILVFYIYMNPLLENEELAQEVLSYDAFTDVEFNPNRSINCQAKAAAVYVSLCKAGLKDKIKDFQSFKKLF